MLRLSEGAALYQLQHVAQLGLADVDGGPLPGVRDRGREALDQLAGDPDDRLAGDSPRHVLGGFKGAVASIDHQVQVGDGAVLHGVRVLWLTPNPQHVADRAVAPDHEHLDQLGADVERREVTVVVVTALEKLELTHFNAASTRSNASGAGLVSLPCAISGLPPPRPIRGTRPVAGGWPARSRETLTTKLSALDTTTTPDPPRNSRNRSAQPRRSWPPSAGTSSSASGTLASRRRGPPCAPLRWAARSSSRSRSSCRSDSFSSRPARPPPPPAGLAHPRLHLIGRDAERARKRSKLAQAPAHERLGRLADRHVDPAQSLADARFRGDQRGSHVRGAGQGRAAAELAGPVPEADHAHPIAVLLFEEVGGAGGDRLLVWQHAGVKGERSPNLLVHASVEPRQFILVQRPLGDEVESGVVRPHPGAALQVAFPGELLQRLVEQVCGRVVAHDLAAPAGVDPGPDPIAQLEPPDAHASQMRDHAFVGPLGVVHLDLSVRPEQAPGVAHLASRLGVEGRAIQVHLHLIALARLGDLSPPPAQLGHPGLALQLVVACEL